MKVAFPTNDRKTIAERTGRCKEFAIFDVVNSNITINYVANHHEHHEHDENKEHEHSHDEAMGILADVDLLIVKKIGKHMKSDLDKNNIKYKKVDEIEINNIIKKIQGGDLNNI